MCRKAVEVMGLWDSDVINWRNQGYCTKHECLVVEGQDGTAICPKLSLLLFKKEREQYKKEFCEFEHWIPLFYQDQLQEMIGISKMFDFYGLVETFNRFATGKTCVVGSENQNIAHLKQFKSMEQIWLAFVMHAKYSKKWDGEYWIK